VQEEEHGRKKPKDFLPVIQPAAWKECALQEKAIHIAPSSQYISAAFGCADS
jgi:hypothetical protein